MKPNRRLLIFITVLFLGVGGIFIYKYYRVNSFSPEPISGNSSSSNGLNCTQLEGEIRDLMTAGSSCLNDSDCFLDVETQLGCPFGCFFIRSQSGEASGYLTRLKSKVAQYHQACPKCLFKCPSLPGDNDIRCFENQCVDIRFTQSR